MGAPTKPWPNPTGQLRKSRPENSMLSPAAGLGGAALEPWGLSPAPGTPPPAPAPESPVSGLREAAGHCLLPASPHPYPQGPSRPPSSSGSPSAGEAATSDSHPRAAVPPRLGDTPARVLGGLFHVRQPSRKSTRKALDQKQLVQRAWGQGERRHRPTDTGDRGRPVPGRCVWMGPAPALAEHCSGLASSPGLSSSYGFLVQVTAP